MWKMKGNIMVNQQMKPITYIKWKYHRRRRGREGGGGGGRKECNGKCFCSKYCLKRCN
jgi:hypothetical protein